MSKPLIRDLLRRKYPENEYALLFEVRNEAGLSASRSADCIAVNLWPSRGCEIIGIEIKSHRSDWIKELKSPEKAEAIAKYCDRWYVLAEKEVVALTEVPASWGFLEVHGSRIKQMKEAPKLAASQLTNSFVAAMLKSSQRGTIPRESIQERIDTEVLSVKQRLDSQYTSTERELKTLNERVRVFEEKSGIDIDSYRYENMAEAVKFVMRGGVESSKQDLHNLKEKSLEIHKYIEKVLEDCPLTEKT